VRNHGESANPVTYLFLLALAGVAFWGYHVGPLYLDNLEAKDAAGEAWSTYLLKGEDYALNQMLVRLNNKNPGTSHYEVDDEGVESVKPGFGVTKDNITFDMNEETKTLSVRLEYDRIVEFKPLKKRKIYHLVAEKKGTIQK
jgi:hypothetical protein